MACDKLKLYLVNPLVLELSCFDHDFVVEIDIPNVGLVAALMQDIGYSLKFV